MLVPYEGVLAEHLQGPETLRETSFVQSFGHDLRIARDHLRRYSVHGDQTEIQQAWDIYYSVSRLQPDSSYSDPQ